MKPKDLLTAVGAALDSGDAHAAAQRARRALLTAMTGDPKADMPPDSELMDFLVRLTRISPAAARDAAAAARRVADGGTNPIENYDGLAEWLTPAEFGAALPGGGRSRSAVYNWIKRDGKIPAKSVMRVGASQLKIRKSELLRFCEWRNL